MFYNTDLLLAGFGGKKNKLILDVYFSAGSTNFDNYFIMGMDKLSIVLNACYRIK